jgi:hypothetical protein
MSIVIKAYGPVGMVISKPTPELVNGEYVKWYDPDACDGHGDVTFTSTFADAKTFATMADAMAYAMRSPASRPLRQDGKPNRPLTVFTLDFERVQ